MDVRTEQSLKRALADLRAERDRLNQSIGALETLVGGGGAAKGPRGKARAAKTPGPKAGRRKPKWSAASRRAAAERMKKYWAARRKSGG